MTKKTYFTTPIYYVNDKPHIGHAYTNILADALTRLHRFLGEEVFFLTGTDEHGEKIAKSAEAKKVPIMDFINPHVERFKELWKVLDTEYDGFIRTTDPEHERIVQRIVEDLYDKGDIYKGKYVGWYSVRSETFYTEDELIDGKCPDTGGDIQRIEEENYFFKLSKYQKWLIEKIQTEPKFICPETRRREVFRFLENPLEDLCISRPKSRMHWGIPLPFDPNYVIYVWFDALVNYISAPGYTEDDKKFKSLWPADCHLVGKDILRHHAVYWPIMLQAMGVECPKKVYAHGWWVMGGEKMSKSKGNIVDPILLSEKYGSDTVRYYVLKEVQLGADGAFSEDLLRERFEKELANDLGNLVHRSFSMLEKYFEGVVQGPAEDYDYLLKDLCGKLAENIPDLARDYNIRGILEEIWKIVLAANKSVEDRKPWALAKDPAQKEFLGSFLYELLETIRLLGIFLSPFMPKTSRKICDLFSEKAPLALKTHGKFGRLKPGVTLKRGEPLFPKKEE